MFGIGFGEFLVIAAVLILVVGPESMPRFMRALARGIREFRRAARELRQQVGLDELLAEEEMRELRAMRQDPLGLREVGRDLRQEAHDWMRRVEGPEPGQPVPPVEGGDEAEACSEDRAGEAQEAVSPEWPRPLPAEQAVPKDPRAWAPKVVREQTVAQEGAPAPLPFRPDGGEEPGESSEVPRAHSSEEEAG